MSPAWVMGIVVGIMCCALSLDVGMIEVYKLRMQNAADAAALGGQVSHDQEDSSWASNGVLDAQANGFSNGVSNVSVTVYQPPTTGTYSGYYDAVEATITKGYHPIFFGPQMTITAKAAALETPCVFLTGARSPSWTSYTLMLQSASSMGRFGGSTMGCPIYFNKGAFVDSYSSLWENSSVSSGTSGQSSLSGGILHQPRYNNATVTDPLSGLAQPSFSVCTAGDTSVSLVNVTKTLSPGTYCKGLNFSGSTVTLSPGLYIITGGAAWTSSTVTGTGVTLFFTTGGGASYGQFIATRSTLALTAPTSNSAGGTPGILFWGDRNWVPTAAQDFQFLYGNGNVGDGIYIYTTNTGILINADNVSAPDYLCFDTDNLDLISTAIQPMSNFTMFPTGNPFTSYLVGLVQ